MGTIVLMGRRRLTAGALNWEITFPASLSHCALPPFPPSARADGHPRRRGLKVASVKLP